MGKNARFGHIWRNVYKKHDYQDVYIHPKSQWSYVIYVDVTSRTAFFNPSIRNISKPFWLHFIQFPLDYKPNLEYRSIIIFPSFLIIWLIQAMREPQYLKHLHGILMTDKNRMSREEYLKRCEEVEDTERERTSPNIW